MEVWSGSVATPSNCNLQGIQLIDAVSTGQCNLSKNSKLSVRAYVNPVLVPLYVQNGPILEVHVTNVETAAWLKGKLLNNTWLDADNWSKLQTEQCPVALVLGVEDPSKRDSRNAACTWQQVTDVLVYGILTSSSPEATRPPTPPPSCATESQSDRSNVDLRIYAVSLCTGRVAKAQTLPSPPQSPRADDTSESTWTAEFLPDMKSPSPKRKRVATLFEAANEFHKKARRRGGIGISESKGKDDSQSFTDSPYMRVKREKSNARSQDVDRAAHQSNSEASSASRPGSQLGSSMVSNTTQPDDGVELPRARSNSIRQGTSALTRKDSACSQTNHPSSAPVKYSQNAEETISANKSLLTRTILTSMRLYGYYRSSRGATRPTTPAPPALEPARSNVDMLAGADGEKHEQSLSNTDDDGGFKEMYHATYRASTFALRSFLRPPLPAAPVQGSTSRNPANTQSPGAPILGQDRAVNVVDSVLRLFCEAQG